MHHVEEVHAASGSMPFTNYALLILVLGVILGLLLGVAFRYALRRLAQSRQERTPQEEPAVEETGQPPLAEVLKARRTAHGMTQEQVAEAVGVSRQAVSKWENGTAEPSTANLMALAKLYGVELSELLSGTN